MTSPLSNSPTRFYNNSAGVCEVPTEPIFESGPMCVARNFTPAPRPTVDLSARYRSSYAEHLQARPLNITSGQLAAAGLSGSGSLSGASRLNPSEVGTSLFLGPLTLLSGCSNGVEELPPTDEVPDPPPTETEEDPDPIPGEHDGIGGVDSSFGTGECLNPAALVASSMSASLHMFCGDDATVDGGNGPGRIELVNPDSGEVTHIELPTEIDSDPMRGIRLSSGVSRPSSGIMFAGYSPAGLEMDFVNGPSILQNSGLLAFDPAGGVPGTDSLVQFDHLTFFTSATDGEPNPWVFNAVPYSEESPQVLHNQIQPNSPVSMTVIGDTLYVLNANDLVQSTGLEGEDIIYDRYMAPATIHAFTIGEGGTLTPAPIGDQNIEVNGESSPGAAFLLDNRYVPAAITATSDGRLAVLTRGIGGADNPSEIVVLDPSNPGDATTYSIQDSGGVNFWAGPSNQMHIVDFEGEPHAMVGAGDDSGRLAMVNLSTGDVRYVGVFSDGNIVSIVPDQAGDQLIAVSDGGQARSVNLTEVDEVQGLPKVGAIHGFPDDARVGALSGSNAIFAHPESYSRVRISAAPVGE